MEHKLKDIIESVAKELGVTEFKTTKVVENMFNYLKNSMTKLESEVYYIPKFGKFTIIPKRLAKHKESIKKKKEVKINNINNTDKSVNNNQTN